MAQYNEYADVANHPLFAQFVRETIGVDVKDIKETDKNMLFYAFRLKVGDLKLEELTDAEKAEIAELLNQNNEENQPQTEGGNKENKNNEDIKQQEPLPTPSEGTRIRSMNSDENDDLLYDARLEILREKGYFKDLKPEDVDTREKVINVVKNQLETMSEDERNSVEYEIYAQMINSEVLFAIMPPKKLAEAYSSYDERIEKSKDDAEKSSLLAEKEKVGARIDELAEMLERDSHYSNDLFFADVTNVSDTYNGYKEMFEARMKDLPEDDERRAKMEKGFNALEVQYNEYLKSWNLQDVTPEKAKELNKRFEQINKGLEKVSLDDMEAKKVLTDSGATLTTLLSNFKFLDENGNIEPQFVDKDGKKSDVYTDGAKVIKGSKLEQSITLAKQLYIQDNLGQTDEINEESLKSALADYLPTVLYNIHIKSQIEKGLAEDINQFTNPAYLQAFKDTLGKLDEPMAVSHNSFEQAKQSLINDAYSYRDVLANRITDKNNPKDAPENKDIVHNICRNLVNIDPRRDMRYEKRVTDNVWGNYASEVVQGMAAAAIGTARVRGAMIVSSAVAGAATGIATGTLMLGASAVVPIGLSIKQYISTRNELKKSGKPYGFKEVFKNKNFLASLGTTALTEAAVACAFAPVPGARVAAVALGGAALAVGIGRAAMNDYKKLRAAGKSKWKALGAAIFGGALKAGTAYLVGHELQSVAQDAGMFNETVKTQDAQEEISHNEWHYDDGVAERAHSTLDKFYGHDTDALNHDLEQVKVQLHAIGRDDIPPEVFLRNAVDAGMNTGIDTINHVQGGPDVHTHGNNTVMTKAWADTYNINYDDVQNFAGIKDADGNIHIDENALRGFDNTKHMVNTNNTIGHMDNVENQTDGVNKFMASVDEETGHNVTDRENPQFYQTYADGDNGLHQVKVIDQEAQEATYETREVDSPYTEYAYGMLGIKNGGWVNKLAKRAGALVDRITGKQPIDNKPQDLVPPQDKTPSQGKAKIEEPMEQPIISPVPTKAPVQNDELRPVEGKTIIVPPPALQNMLVDEFKIVHNAEPSSEALLEYRKLVQYEFNKAIIEKSTKAATMQEYMQERKDTFEKQLAQNLGVDRLDKIEKSDINQMIDNARDMAKGIRMKGGKTDVTLINLGENLMPAIPQKDTKQTVISQSKGRSEK